MRFRAPVFKMASKFHPLSKFEKSLEAGYQLLPFRFTRLDEQKYVLTNQAGEFLVADREVISQLANQDLSSDNPLYNDLKSKHFLIDADSDVAIDLLGLKVRTKAHRLADFTGLHLFVTTLRCEHSCPYCQVSRQKDSGTHFDMSSETADRSLDLTFCSPSPNIKIEFQGGESLLNFALIEHIVHGAHARNENKSKDLQFVIATNLAVLTDEMLAFCRAHDIHISTSLDGPRALHNRNRPRPGNDSYERTIAGIGRVRTALGKDRVAALMTTSEASLGCIREIVDEYISLEFEGIFLRPLSPYGFAVKTKWYDSYDENRWLQFYFEGLDYIIDINRTGHHFIEQYAATILNKMLSPFPTGYVDLMSPAGIGIAAVVYNYDGDVYASDEGRMLAEMDDRTFRLGNVHRNSYEEIFGSDALLDPLEQSYAGSVPMCVDCAFEPFCGADPVFHHATQGDFVGRKATSAFCRRNMSIFRGLITRMRSNPKTAEMFRRWLH